MKIQNADCYISLDNLLLLYCIMIIYYQNYLVLFLAPFITYPFAWSGHYFFEKNKPAAFTNPLYAKISDWIMFKDVLLGSIKNLVRLH